ncbi:MAG: hypothetical protein HC830_09085 [Bacteroidetes bacterium]|nr:hypothetical protein [Bacteroidota bacterium]
MKIYSPYDITEAGLCIGCGICVAQSKNKDASMLFDGYGQLKPGGPSEWYKKPSVSFSSICPFSPNAENEDTLSAELFPDVPQNNASLGRYIANWVGYVEEEDFRGQGSSGGMVSWVQPNL